MSIRYVINQRFQSLMIIVHLECASPRFFSRYRYRFLLKIADVEKGRHGKEGRRRKAKMKTGGREEEQKKKKKKRKATMANHWCTSIHLLNSKRD